MNIIWIKSEDIDFSLDYKINKKNKIIQVDTDDYSENIDLSDMEDGDIIFRQDPLTSFSPLVNAYVKEGEMFVYLLSGIKSGDYDGDMDDVIDESNPLIYLTLKKKSEIDHEKKNLIEVRDKRVERRKKIESSPEEIDILKKENADVWYEKIQLQKELLESKQELADLWYYVISGSEDDV